MAVPDSITREQYITACAAFCGAVGLDPTVTCVPLILDEDGIHFTISLSDEDGRKQLASRRTDVANHAAILSATGKIEVRG